MSGFSAATSSWVRGREESQALAQEILSLIQERNVSGGSGPDASRRTATARRKLGTLGINIDNLLKGLEDSSAESAGLSEAEKNRRRDMVYDLQNRREQMQQSLKRNAVPSVSTSGTAGGQGSARELLPSPAAGGPGGSSSSYMQQSRETEATAELDTQGLMQMQNQVMKNQDMALENMEKAIGRTKHVARAIGEEVNLQTRLLEDLDDHVEVTQTRLKAATGRIKQLMRNSSNWKGGLCIFLLIVTLVFVMIVVLKLHRLFGG